MIIQHFRELEKREKDIEESSRNILEGKKLTIKGIYFENNYFMLDLIQKLIFLN